MIIHATHIEVNIALWSVRARGHCTHEGRRLPCEADVLCHNAHDCALHWPNVRHVHSGRADGRERARSTQLRVDPHKAMRTSGRARENVGASTQTTLAPARSKQLMVRSSRTCWRAP